jgi:hypothetical protein
MGVSVLQEVLLRVDVVRREVFKHLSLRDLHVFSLTSSLIREVVGPDLAKRCNVDRKLRKFVSDPHMFCNMLRDTRGVVTGEFAREIFLEESQSDNLCIVVVDPFFYEGAKMLKWERYLTGVEGYSTPSLCGVMYQRATQVCVLVFLIYMLIFEDSLLCS